MNLLGFKNKIPVQSLSSFLSCTAVMAVLFVGSGCVGTQNVRRAKPIPVDAPEGVEVVAAEAPESSNEAVAEEVLADNGSQPSDGDIIASEDEIVAAVARGESGVAEVLKQTRGAVFASLTTPAGAGPPASAVRASEPGSSADPGFQDSTTQLTGADSISAEPSGEAENAGNVVEPSEKAVAVEEGEVNQEEAETSIAENAPSPVPGVPAEPVESAVTEAAKVDPPPEVEPLPLTQDNKLVALTTQDPAGSGVEDGTQSNTASVLFLILGGVGAALILLRKRVTA